jgi:hypothetical protein
MTITKQEEKLDFPVLKNVSVNDNICLSWDQNEVNLFCDNNLVKMKELNHHFVLADVQFPYLVTVVD